MVKEGKFICIIGLPASGKTTIAKEVYKALKEKYPHTVHLDGDDLRSAWGMWAENGLEGRKKMALSYVKQCHILTKQGINVILSTVSLFHDVHKFNRETFSEFYEIFVDTDKEIILKRFTEETAEDSEKRRWLPEIAEYPLSPSLVIKNNHSYQLEENIKKILDLIDN